MVKAGKKSATKVNDAPAVNPSSKSIKKGGKREAEEAIEKIVNAKKQKTGLDTKQAVPVKKPEVKTQKKKKEESSSSDDSSSEEDEKQVNVVTKKAAKPPVEESSSDEPSSDEGVPAKTTAPVKQTPAKKGKVDSSSDSSDDESDEDEEPPAKAVAPAKKQPAGLKNGKAESSSSDSSDDESDEDEKPSAKAAVPLKKAKADSSSSDDEDSSSDEDAKPSAKIAASVKKQPDTKNGPVKKAKPESSSSDSSDDDDSSSDEEVPKSAVAMVAPQAAGSKKAESSDSSDESDSDDDKPQNKSTQQNKMDIDKEESSEESEDEKPQAQSKKTQVTAKKESSSDEESSEESSDDEAKTTKKNVKVAAPKESSSDDSSDEEVESDDEKSVKTPKKNASDVEMIDTSPHTAKNDDSKSANKAPQTPVTPSSSKTLFVGNLSYDVERDDVENFFKDAGEVVDVRFAIDKEDQRFKGFGHVEFATAEAAQKALKLNGKKLNGRDVRLDLARERGAPYTPQSGGKDYNSFQKGGRSQGQKVYVRGFDKDLGEDEIRESLQEHFKSCGEVSRISIPTDRETGSIKGMAYLEFQDSDGFNKALELNNSEFGNNYLTVEEAKPPRSDGGRDGGFNSGRGRRGGGFGGRRGGGRDGGRGNRGRGGRGFNKPSITTASSGKKTTFGDYDD